MSHAGPGTAVARNAAATDWVALGAALLALFLSVLALAIAAAKPSPPPWPNVCQQTVRPLAGGPYVIRYPCSKVKLGG